MSPTRPTFDLELLRTFVTVAACDTFADAGVALGRTQFSITQQMQRLEAMSGAPLFQKEGRNKLLSEHGRQLLRYARDLLALKDDAMHALHDKSEGGTLRLGSPHDVASTLLPQVLGRIARFMPQLQVDITVARSPQLMEKIVPVVTAVTCLLIAPDVALAQTAAVIKQGESTCAEAIKALNVLADFTESGWTPAKSTDGKISLIFISKHRVFDSAQRKRAYLVWLVGAAGSALNRRPHLPVD